MAVFKSLYRGRGIYWHGRDGYGDETNGGHATVASVKSAIDAIADAEDARRSAIDVYWDALSPEARGAMRRGWVSSGMVEDSVADYAYAMRPDRAGGAS